MPLNALVIKVKIPEKMNKPIVAWCPGEQEYTWVKYEKVIYRSTCREVRLWGAIKRKASQFTPTMSLTSASDLSTYSGFS